MLLSYIIQNHIISSMFDNYNSNFTLKYNLEKQDSPNFCFDYSGYISISKYSFVCKHWFNYIRSLFNNCRLNSLLPEIDCDYDENNSMTINNEYSFFQFKNITHLYLNLESIIDEPKAVDFIKNFSNLERLIINTNNIQLVKDISIRYPAIKLELFTGEYYDNDFSLLDTISEESLDFIHVTSSNSIDGNGLEEKDDFVKHYKRFNSIYFEYGDKTENEDRIHITHSDILSNKSLQYITISDVCVYVKDLIKVVKYNNHIISFRTSVPLYILGDNDNNCVCYRLNQSRLLLKDNKLEHWIEFCQQLATNSTLKSLHISDSNCSKSAHSLTDEVQKVISDAFYSALESNQTLEFLTIPSRILTDSFYHGLSNINQTIKDIHFEDILLNHLLVIGDCIRINKSIKTLRISFKRKYRFKDNDKKSKPLKSFINGLRKNQTLVTLELPDSIYNLLKKDKKFKFEIKSIE